MRPKTWMFPFCALSIGLLSQRAKADCSRSSQSLGCFDAAPSIGPAEPSAFRWISEGKVLTPGSLALGFHFQYAHAPLELIAPASDPSGRPISVVKENNRFEMRAALGMARGIDVTLAIPFTASQFGTGSDAISTQNPTPIAQTGLGDMRLGFRTSLPKFNDALDMTLRLELTLPTGEKSSYLGEIGPTEAVAATAGYNLGPLLLGAEIGARVRKEQRFSDVAIGSQILFGLGVAWRILAHEQLTVALESYLRPLLSTQPTLKSKDFSPATTHATWVMPAEWMGSVVSRPGTFPLWVSLGAGTALPLSFRDSTEGHVTSNFIAPTTPRAKVTASATFRY